MIDKSILIFIVILIIGFWFTMIIEKINLTQFGILSAITIMGAPIIYFNNKNKKR